MCVCVPFCLCVCVLPFFLFCRAFLFPLCLGMCPCICLQVLIPVFALGRAQELCILIETYWDRMGLSVPVYFSAGLVERANLYYQLYIQWTNQKIKSTFTERLTPPQSLLPTTEKGREIRSLLPARLSALHPSHALPAGTCSTSSTSRPLTAS